MTGQFSLSSRRLAILAALAIAFFAALAASSIGTHTAFAGQPPICDEYPELPQCDEDDDDDDDNRDEDDEGGNQPGGGGGAGPTGDAGDGELPFTGYPLTSLMLLLLVLLATGLAIRSYLAIRDRLRSGHSPLRS